MSYTQLFKDLGDAGYTGTLNDRIVKLGRTVEGYETAGYNKILQAVLEANYGLGSPSLNFKAWREDMFFYSPFMGFAGGGGGGGSRTGTFDISLAGSQLSTGTAGATTEGFWVNNEGTQLLVGTGSNILEYSMSTPHDLSTMTLETTHTAFGGQVWAMDFSPDGNRAVIYNQSKTCRIYDCSSPFDLSSAVLDESVSGFGGTGTQAFGFTWLDANTFCINVSGRFSFWTGAADYSLVGATQGSILTVSGAEGGMAPKPDGSLFVTGVGVSSRIREYDCSTALDASTGVLGDEFIQTGTPKYVCFNYNGDYLYYQYSSNQLGNRYVGVV